jgi:hypothetical protein
MLFFPIIDAEGSGGEAAAAVFAAEHLNRLPVFEVPESAFYVPLPVSPLRLRGSSNGGGIVADAETVGAEGRLEDFVSCHRRSPLVSEVNLTN